MTPRVTPAALVRWQRWAVAERPGYGRAGNGVVRRVPDHPPERHAGSPGDRSRVHALPLDPAEIPSRPGPSGEQPRPPSCRVARSALR